MKNLFIALLVFSGLGLGQLQAQSCSLPCKPECCALHPECCLGPCTKTAAAATATAVLFALPAETTPKNCTPQEEAACVAAKPASTGCKKASAVSSMAETHLSCQPKSVKMAGAEAAPEAQPEVAMRKE
jgi:hypothetical protein